MFQVDRAIVESLNRIAQHEPLRLAALGAAGAAGALGLDQLAGHLYFRRRPYWALPTVHPIGPPQRQQLVLLPHAWPTGTSTRPAPVDLTTREAGRVPGSG